MKFKSTQIVTLSCALIILLVTAHLYLLDGLTGGLFLRMLGEDDTVYADGYSDAAYRQIRRGSTATEVRNLLGEPFETFGMIEDRRADDGWWYGRPESDATGWSYTITPNSSHYRKRIIVFREGHVVDKVNKIYVD